METLSMQPDIYHHLPEGFFKVQPQNITSIFPKPSLIMLEGRRKQALFLSILLHGNEHSSLAVAQNVLSKYVSRQLPRNVMLFVGNVEACQGGQRYLAGQQDFNRIWAGGNAPEHALADAVLEQAQAHDLFASIDIHNNTGRNPLYSCVGCLEPEFLNLASLFSHLVVYSQLPQEVQYNAFTKLCPAVTIECGLSGATHGITAAVNMVDAVLNLDHMVRSDPVRSVDKLYHTVARIRLPQKHGITFIPDIDRLNFSEVSAGTCIGWLGESNQHLIVEDNQGQDVSQQYINYVGQEIRFKKSAVPSMFTTDPLIIQQDCLGYLMQPYQM